MQKPERITFICGPHGSGKTYVSQLLTQTDSHILHLDCGPTIRAKYKLSGSLLPMHEWIIENNKKYGTNYTNNLVREEFLTKAEKYPDDSLIIISGVRCMQHIYYLCEPWQIKTPAIIFINCDEQLSKLNCEKREGKTFSNKEFQMWLQHDQDMGLQEVYLYVKTHPQTCTLLLNNNNCIEEKISTITQIVYRADVNKEV